MFPRMRAGIEAAAPLPRIGVVRIAGALGNRPDMNIDVVNVPTLSVVFGSAAGEFGLAVLKRRTRGKATPAIGGLTLRPRWPRPFMRGELDKLPKRYEAHRTVRTLSNPSGQLSQNCLAAVQQFTYDGFFNIFWRHRDH